MQGQDENTTQLPTDEYWAAVDVDKLPDTIRAKANGYRKQLDDAGLIALYRMSERTYYGQDGEGGWANSAAVTYGGEDGELVMLRVNHYRSIMQGILTTAARARLAFSARALSTDTEALGEASLATGVVEAYFRTLGLEPMEYDAGRAALMLAEGWVGLRWNPFAGRRIGVTQRPVFDDSGKPRTQMVEQPVMQTVLDGQTGEETQIDTGEVELVEQPITEPWIEREGEMEAQLFSPIEIVHDLDAPARDLKWCMVPYRENAWDLAARYPQHRQRILDQRKAQRWPRSAWAEKAWETPDTDEDTITVWWLYHMPSSALPDGRHAIVAGDVVLFDGPMDLTEVSVYSMIPERELSSASGYSPMWDLLALCAAYDAVFDVAISSHDALGMQNVLAPKGSDVSIELISRGLQVIKYTVKPDQPNGGKPEALQLLAISGDTFKLMEIIQRLEEVLSGLNSAARGEPPANLKSGTAIAFVQSLSVAFNSGFQAELVDHAQRVATGVLKLAQKFATGQRVAEVAGRSKRAAIKQWSKDSLQKVSRIVVEVASPLMQQESGRLQVAQDLLNGPRGITPQEYFEVLETGKLEAMYESTLSRVRHIRTENELMLEGKEVPVGNYDDHGPHVWEHLGLLDSPEARANDALVTLVSQHVDEHLAKWATMPQPVALLTRQTVMPPAPLLPPGPPPPPAGAHPPGPPPNGPNGHGPQGVQHPPHLPAPKAAPLGHDGGPGMPSMPQPPTA